MDDPTITDLPEEPTLLVCYERILDSQQRAYLTQALEQSLPGRRVIVLDGGAKVSGVVDHAQLQRIEAKLDALLEALGEDEPQLEATTLDGQRFIAAERDQTRSLG